MYLHNIRQKKVMVGYDPLYEEYSIISFRIYKGSDPRAKDFSFVVHEEQRVFNSQEEVKTFLNENYPTIVDMANPIEIAGIIGFLRFRQGFYMLVFKGAKPSAKLGSI